MEEALLPIPASPIMIRATICDHGVAAASSLVRGHKPSVSEASHRSIFVASSADLDVARSPRSDPQIPLEVGSL